MPSEIHRTNHAQQNYELAAMQYAEASPQAPFKSLEPLVPAYEPHDPPYLQHPITNDALAEQYNISTLRAENPGFRDIKHKTALIVGESALIAALPYIPEETIIVADVSPDMLWYMTRYRDTLRTSTTSSEWRRNMAGLSDNRKIRQLWDQQVADWEGAGLTHPFNAESHYTRSRQAAHEKAIIPYDVDIIDKNEVGNLAKTLRLGAAAITFLNYTNIMGYNRNRQSGAEMIATLDLLPLTPDVTILASSPFAKNNQTNRKLGLYTLGALGPFSGTAELLAASTANPGQFDLLT